MRTLTYIPGRGVVDPNEPPEEPKPEPTWVPRREHLERWHLRTRANRSSWYYGESQTESP
jgi:hypothetical protein